MNTKLDKLESHAKHLLQFYWALRKQYEYMAPMIFNPRIAAVFNGKNDADVFSNIRINLYYLCIQDIANLWGDKCSKTPSIFKFMEEIGKPDILQALRCQSLNDMPISVHHSVDTDMAAQAKRRKKIAFGVRLYHLNRRWEILSNKGYYSKFRKVRDKITAHAELQFDGRTYNRFPIESLKLKWGDLKSALDSTEPIVLSIYTMFTGGSFQGDGLYRSMRYSIRAFYNRWLLTSRCT